MFSVKVLFIICLIAILICYVITSRNIWNAFIIAWFCSTFKTASDFSSHELKKERK